ncbi:MAG: hypothetical protein WCJ70_04885 [bacterium]
MNLSKKIALSTLMVAALVSISSSPVSARGMGGAVGHDSLITKIAQKFGLKEADVRGVFDTQHTEHMAQMQTRMSDRLTQLVKDGKITEAQKKLIIVKHAEMQKKMQSQKDAMKDKTHAERKALMDAKRAELEQWAKSNGIDAQYLLPFGGSRHGMMNGMNK